jgi:chitinase
MSAAAASSEARRAAAGPAAFASLLAIACSSAPPLDVRDAAPFDAPGLDAPAAGDGGLDAIAADAGALDAGADDAASDAGSADAPGLDAPWADAPSGPSPIAEWLDAARFEALFLHRGTAPCRGSFYTHAALLAAAATFPAFGATGDESTRRREVAAFLAQVAHETTGGWPTAPDGPYSWGLCWITEGATVDPALLPDYCAPSAEWPCAPGRKYFGRGPIQISWNYNYGQCGAALGMDLLGDPDLVTSDPVVAFRTALWFWMTPQSPKPSAHDVMTGGFAPSDADLAAGRLPGFGLTTNIINGGLECGRGADARVADRIGFFERFTALLGTDVGTNLDCGAMRPY